MTKPISPHLSIYKKQISSVLSILHRISGAGVFIGLLLFVLWFTGFVFSNFAYCYIAIFAYWPIKLLVFLTAAGLIYHLCNGIRHLFWDMGLGFSIPVMHKTGWAVVIVSALLLLLFWIYLV